jgi:hypothetical protein
MTVLFNNEVDLYALICSLLALDVFGPDFFEETNLILIQPNQNLISNDSQSLKLLYKHCKKLPTRQTALEILISIKPLTNKRHLFKNLNTTPATKNYLQRFKFFYLKRLFYSSPQNINEKDLNTLAISVLIFLLS